MAPYNTCNCHNDCSTDIPNLNICTYRYVDIAIGKDTTLVYPKILGYGGPDEANVIRITIIKEYRNKFCSDDNIYLEFKDIKTGKCNKTKPLKFINYIAEFIVPPSLITDPTTTLLVQIVVESGDNNSLIYRSKVYCFGVGKGIPTVPGPLDLWKDLDKRITALEQLTGSHTYIFETQEEADTFIAANPDKLNIGDILHIKNPPFDGWWDGTSLIAFTGNGGTSSHKTTVIKQLAASNRWEIKHNLDNFPSVTTVDSGGNIVVGDVQYIDNNNIVINFNTAFSGKVYLN